MLSGEFTAAKIDGLIAEMGVGKLVVPKGTSPEEWTARRPALPAPAPPLWNKTRGNLATVRTFPPCLLGVCLGPVLAGAGLWMCSDMQMPSLPRTPSLVPPPACDCVTSAAALLCFARPR